MCYFRITGGLGNQMFQYATAYAFANKLGNKVFLDISEYKNYKRPFELDKLKINATNLLTIKEKKIFYVDSKIKRLLLKLKLPYQKFGKTYEERFFHYNEQFYYEAKNSNLITGYFQSPKYFSEYKKDLLELFQPKNELSLFAKKWHEQIKNVELPISIHVRRGDYLNKECQGVHNTLDISYYKNAISLMQKLYTQKTTFFIFSDDEKYCQNNFSWLENKKIVANSTQDAYEEMFLMSFCRHNIIANSTFSWWGAWLNQNPNKKVIAPYFWFNPNFQVKNSPQDLYEKEWIILQ